jgi:cell wall-associated NlpC family hydrolase
MIDTMMNYAHALLLMKIPYKWGGHCPLNGLDCSQYVQEVLASIGKDPIGDQTAQTLYEIMRVYCKEDIVRRGTILFFGRHKKDITHVGIAINDKYMYEAGGGGSSTTTWEEAIRKNAMVRIRPIRKDLVCFLNLE